MRTLNECNLHAFTTTDPIRSALFVSWTHTCTWVRPCRGLFLEAVTGQVAVTTQDCL